MKPLVKVPLKYAAIAAVLGFCIVVLLYAVDRHPFMFPPYLDSRIFLFGIFMFFMLKELREEYLNGILYFWQGLISGFIFLLFFSVIASTAIWAFAIIKPDFVQSYIKLAMQFVSSFPPDEVERIGKDVVKSNLERLPSTNAVDMAMLYFSRSLMIGLFLNIIMSVILRRTPKP